MEIFVDTSAIFALLDKETHFNQNAILTWERLLQENVRLVTNNYVLVESFTLLQSRLGLSAAVQLQSKIAPLLEIEWINEQQHSNTVNQVLGANRRNLSLVDCSSFDTMRSRNIEKAFTFDKHFQEQGFTVIP